MDNFFAPIHRSLTQSILVGGAPREFTILNLVIGGAITFGLKTLLVVPVFLLLHVVAVALTKRDPDFFATLRAHLNHKHYYDA